MKNGKKLWALGLALMFILSGCGGGPEAPSAAPSAEPSPSVSPSPTPTPAPAASGDGFNMVVCLGGEPASIDPGLVTAEEEISVAGHLFEGLMTWRGSVRETADGALAGELVPGQAADYEKEEGKEGTAVYTFHIRPDAKWSDGKPVTAHDFVYAWQRLVTPATRAGSAYILDCVVNAKEIMAGTKEPKELGVEAVDDATFAVTVQDVPYFLEICAHPGTFPLRQDVIEKDSTQWTYEPESCISNGAYKLKLWEHNSQLVLEPSETYYDAAAQGPKTITFAMSSDTSAALSTLEAGNTHFILEPTAKAAELLEKGTLRMADYMGSYYAVFQTEAEPFNDPLVRQAFTLAVDRSRLAKAAFGKEAGGLVPGGVYDATGAEGDDFRTVGGSFYPLGAGNYAANCDKARELLAEAGYPGGKGFPEVEYLYNTGAAHQAAAEALKEMWEKELGVKVTVVEQPWAQFLKTRKSGEFQIARGSWLASYNDPMSFLDSWVTGSSGNAARYANSEFDDLIAKAQSDPRRRMELLHQGEELLVGTDWAVCPLYFNTRTYCAAEGLTGLTYTPQGWFFFHGCAVNG